MPGPWEQYAKPGGAGPWTQYGAGSAGAPDLGPTPEEPRTVGGFLGNVVKSGAKLAGDVVNMVAHPIDTIQAIGGIPVGLWTKAGLPVPKDWNNAEATKELDGIVQHLTSRYGSLDAAKRAMYEDPVGVAADASAVLGGVAGGARAAGLTRVARVAEAVNPANLAVKGAKAAAPLAAKVGNAVIDASQIPAVSTGAKVIGLSNPALHPVAAASVGLDLAAEARSVMRNRRAAKVAAERPSLDPRVEQVVSGGMSADELFGPMSEVPPEAAAPVVEQPPVRLRNPATEAPREPVTLRNPEAPPPMTDAEIAQMRADQRYAIRSRNKPEPAPVADSGPSVDVEKPELPPVEAPPAQPPVVEATPAVGSMDDLRRGVQSILDRRKSSAAVNKPAPMSEQPAPVVETAPPVFNEPFKTPQPVKLRNPAEEAPDYATKARAAKVDAFVEHLNKYNFTPDLVDAISDRQWSAVAQSAGQNAPSAETIAAVKERFGANYAPKKPPTLERVTLRNPNVEAVSATNSPAPESYYASIVDGSGRKSLAVGPFPTHEQALEYGQGAKRADLVKAAREVDPGADFYGYGTAKVTGSAKPGVLNARVGYSPDAPPPAAAVDPPAPRQSIRDHPQFVKGEPKVKRKREALPVEDRDWFQRNYGSGDEVPTPEPVTLRNPAKDVPPKRKDTGKVKLRPNPEQGGEIDPDNVAALAKAYKAKAPIPPIVAFDLGGGQAQIIEGHHRAAAAAKARVKPDTIIIPKEQYEAMRADGMTLDEIEYAAQKPWREARKQASR
jgi:hypothetical protein